MTNPRSLKYFVIKNVTSEDDIRVRLENTRGDFIKLKNIWKFYSISRIANIRLYNSYMYVLSVLLYGAECWRMTETEISTNSQVSTMDA